MQGFIGEAEDGPFLLGFGAKRFIELDGGGVPIEYRPFQAGAAALDGEAGEFF